MQSVHARRWTSFRMADFVYSSMETKTDTTKGQVKVVLGTYTQVRHLESHKYQEGIKIDWENGKTL